MEEIEGQYLILAYVDDLEESMRLARKNNLNEELTNGIQTVHDDLVELEAFLKTEADNKRLQADVEELIEELVKNCRNGEEKAALKNMKQLRDRIRSLKGSLI